MKNLLKIIATGDAAKKILEKKNPRKHTCNYKLTRTKAQQRKRKFRKKQRSTRKRNRSI